MPSVDMTFRIHTPVVVGNRFHRDSEHTADFLVTLALSYQVQYFQFSTGECMSSCKSINGNVLRVHLRMFHLLKQLGKSYPELLDTRPDQLLVMLENCIDNRKQHLRAERFGDVSDGTLLKGVNFLLNRVTGCEKNQGNGFLTQQGLHLFEEGMSIHVRHHDIADDQIKSLTFKELEAFQRCRSTDHLVCRL
ncbi:hypothetical protein SDC9_194077 [bioreactor metagenome]|uniref:Uncharacterized protein n=1 Tax=bioreactor metagenome TaxID=1076179 RepID=A0A645I5B7_9ZZZZ